MAEAPLSRIVIMTEDGSTIRPTEAVTIPPPIPSLNNQRGRSTVPISQIFSGVAALDVIDQQIQELGYRMTNDEAQSMVQSIIDGITDEMTLAKIIERFQAAIDVLKTLPPAPDATTTLGSSMLLPRQVRGGLALMTKVVDKLKEKGFLR